MLSNIIDVFGFFFEDVLSIYVHVGLLPFEPFVSFSVSGLFCGVKFLSSIVSLFPFLLASLEGRILNCCVGHEFLGLGWPWNIDFLVVVLGCGGWSSTT